MNSNLLKDKSVYLSGAIEACTESTNWRLPVIRELTERYGLSVYDPHADEKQKFTGELAKARSEKNYVELQRIAKNFVSKDLGKVDRQDFLIARISYKKYYECYHSFAYHTNGKEEHSFESFLKDIQVPTTGTVHEIINADLYKKPTLLVCERGKEWIPFWYYGIVNEKYMFGNWNDLYKYLDEVNEGKHVGDSRWKFTCDIL